MALNENQILDLLNDGYDSDIDVLDENDDRDDDLEILLHNFENDDLLGFLEAYFVIRLLLSETET